MAEGDTPEVNIEVKPDVQPGSLVFLDPADLKNRYVYACCEVDDFMTEGGLAEIFCDDHFCDFVSEVVVRAMRCFGLADFNMDPEVVGAVYAALRAGIAAVQ